jgi:Trypsin-like peptidase domain
MSPLGTLIARKLSLPGKRRLNALATEVRQDDWARIDSVWERFRIRHGLHLRRDTGLDPHGFVVEALEEAQSLCLLRELANELIKEDLVTPRFPARLRGVVGASAYEVQAFTNRVFRPVNALVAGKDLLAACDHVCRIDIDREPTGTGVQVSPTLVATAAHVVWPLIARGPDGAPDLRADGSLQSAVGSLGRLNVTFGDVMDYLEGEESAPQPRKGEAARLHPEWLAWGSPPTENERPGALFDVYDIDGIKSDTGPWDLALIRLAVPRRTARAVRLLDEDPPSDPFQINILHHPRRPGDGAEPLLWSIGQLDSQLGDPHPVRCLHDADTLRGSSGAPVFDRWWKIVALHQGGMRVLQSFAEASSLPETGRNRAVPIKRWYTQLGIVERSVPHDVPYLTELTSSRDLSPYPYPVIGRHSTQQRLWQAMQADATPVQRLLIIRGTPGTGLRFTKRLVREFVTINDGGAVVTLTMTNALDQTAAGFAERVAGALATQLEVADGETLTTPQRSVRSELVPTLGERLERAAGGRATWLALDDFDDTGTDIPSAVKDLIVELISCLEKYPFLRLVLVGWLETPGGYEQSVEELLPPTVEDVAGHWAPSGEMPDPRVVQIIEPILAASAVVDYPTALQIVQQLAPIVHRMINSGGAA